MKCIIQLGNVQSALSHSVFEIVTVSLNGTNRTSYPPEENGNNREGY